MQLTRIERLLLSNQLRILEALYPKEAQAFAHQREAIEWGYEHHYRHCVEHVLEDTLPEEACIEVIDTLDMFDALKLAMDGIGEIPEVKDWQVAYAGFDGNDEPHQLAYARWFCDEPNCRFAALQPAKNSHMPVVERYRRQLTEWKKCADRHELSREDVIRIAQAAIHPENR